MGVMECNKKDCDNILCEKYVENYGYICDSCYKELLKINPKSPEDVIVFMETSKLKFLYNDSYGKFDINKMIN